jgi:hypothetical protein
MLLKSRAAEMRQRHIALTFPHAWFLSLSLGLNVLYHCLLSAQS